MKPTIKSQSLLPLSLIPLGQLLAGKPKKVKIAPGVFQITYPFVFVPKQEEIPMKEVLRGPWGRTEGDG